jgi:hypothetical protein
MRLKIFLYKTSQAFFLLMIFLSIYSCKKDNNESEIYPKPATPENGSMIVSINHLFDTINFVLNDQYILDNGNKISISTYKYYISNIKLTADDGSVFSETESYHLVNAEQTSTCSFSISKVPFKKYSSISFIIGVDSTRNVSGAQSGALDVALGMFWTWNTGYIMAKLEGTSQQSSAPGNSVAFHIGGFKGNFNALKQVSISFNGNLANVTSSSTPTLYLKNNIKEWFINPNSLDLSITNNITMVNATSKSIADNYADMFGFKSIQN